MKNEMFEFDSYYDIVAEKLSKMGYSKSPDADTVREDYDADKSPEESAKAFSDVWGDPGDEDID